MWQLLVANFGMKITNNYPFINKNMKNHIIPLLLFCLVFASCSKEVAYNDIQKESNNSLLISEMSDFNDSLLQTVSQTRASNKQILDRMSIVVADAIGAYECGSVGAKIGAFFGHPHVGAGICALVGGAYSSYKCYDLLHSTRALSSPVKYQPLQVAAAYVPAVENTSIIQNNLPKQISINFSEPNDEAIEFGAKHNVIVSNLQTNNFAIDSDVKKLLTKEEFEILSSNDFIDEYDNIVNNLSDCIVNKRIPQNANEDVSSMLMNLFASILETYSDKLEDTEFIINKYLDAVQRSSELTSEEKDNIYKSLSVAASSFEFWNGK